VASKHGVPHVVIPAGTRNHFALDLGLDRDDVVGALDAYHTGIDTVMDLAELNGRTFVNNASLGVYAKVVQSSEYRDAKIQTAATLLPDILGPDATPMDLRHRLPSGEEAATAQLILVSNNPYELQHLSGMGTRDRLDTGQLGIVSLYVGGPADVQRLAGLTAVGQVNRFAGWREWQAPSFEIRSNQAVEVGVDGEALLLEPPLRFEIRPAALTVRLPTSASRPPRAVRVTSGATVKALWRLTMGKPVESS
jgi:diacylglycerol kinase family enzyme